MHLIDQLFWYCEFYKRKQKNNFFEFFLSNGLIMTKTQGGARNEDTFLNYL